MLPASHRLRRSDDFRRAVRSGRRAGSRAVVVHLAVMPSIAEPARVGFVVNKAVGNAVLRNRVERRLRAVVAGRLDQLPPGSTTVVRALPAAATATYAELEADIAAALDRLLAPAARRFSTGDQRRGDRSGSAGDRGGAS